MTMVIQVLRPFDLSASFSFLCGPLILMNVNLIESLCHSDRLSPPLKPAECSRITGLLLLYFLEFPVAF